MKYIIRLFVLVGIFLSPLSVFAGGPPSGLLSKLFPKTSPIPKKLPSPPSRGVVIPKIQPSVKPIDPLSPFQRAMSDWQSQRIILKNRSADLSGAAEEAYAQSVRVLNGGLSHADEANILPVFDASGKFFGVKRAVDGKAVGPFLSKSEVDRIAKENLENVSGNTNHLLDTYEASFDEMRMHAKQYESNAKNLSVNNRALAKLDLKKPLLSVDPRPMNTNAPLKHKDDYTFDYTIAIQRAIKNGEDPATVIRGQLSGLQKRADDLNSIKSSRTLTAQEDEELLALESFIFAITPR